MVGDRDAFVRRLRAKTEEVALILQHVFHVSNGGLANILNQLQLKDAKAHSEVLTAGSLPPCQLEYTQFSNGYGIRTEPLIEYYVALSESLPRLAEIGDVTFELQAALAQGKKIVAEAGQGARLDVLYGTWPTVTSSGTLAGNACCGAGLGPTQINDVLGVFKAYDTRVGNGVFPTEDEALGKRIRGDDSTIGAERGTTTGRPRRIGWLDLPLLRRSIMLNAPTAVAMTKLDFLDALREIKVCTSYRLDGQHLDMAPNNPDDLARVEPVYTTLPGWQQNISQATDWPQLPANAQRYVQFVAQACRMPFSPTPIPLIGVGNGANQNQFIFCEN